MATERKVEVDASHVHLHPVHDMDKHFIIDPITRSVTNADGKKTILMQNDHNSERFTFEIDRFVEDHDMSLCNQVEIHYSNYDVNKKDAVHGVYEVRDLAPKVAHPKDEPERLTFSWLVSQNATVYNGTLSFIVTFACVTGDIVTYRWSSGINTSITIAKGLNNGDAIAELYPDILSQWKSSLFAAVYGMVDVHVGPDEPAEFPYIWFDTSVKTGATDENVGLLTIKDADGNKETLYPLTVIEATDEPDMAERVATLEERVKNTITSMSVFQKTYDDHVIGSEEDIKNINTELFILNKIVETKATVFSFKTTVWLGDWSNVAPYEQTISLPGVKSTDEPIVDVMSTSVDEGTDGTLNEWLSNWGCITRVVANDDSITLYAHNTKPTTSIPIKLKVVR